MREARRFYRRPVDLAAIVELPGGVEVCRIANLSIDGAYLLLRPLPAALTVRLDIVLPGWDEPFEVAATVTWSDHRGAGVRFDRLRTEQVWKLGHFLARMVDQPSAAPLDPSD